ncbi:MAG: hypothetical protein H0U76_08560, partial [Ktedonobacteraceae bacterium]|nr:hypothetical protein [Ktedonobacteraceae bacterium]MBA3915164.1 hypothetical protein [Terriglobales bacterium]
MESIPKQQSSCISVGALSLDKPAGAAPERKTFHIQVQAQFTVEAETLDDACDLAVDQAMEMDST